MIPLHVFTIAGSNASSLRVGGNPEDYLKEYPQYTHDFTVYGFDINLPVFPPYIKPLIILEKDSFPYTTKLVDVVYSIFPSPEGSEKIAVYRRPVRNTVPVYFYKVSDGVKASLEELPLEPAMELHRVFMTTKEYSVFAAISETCTPVDGEFSDSTNFDKCVETTNVRTSTESGSSPMVVDTTETDTTDATDTQKTCWNWIALVASGMLLILLLAIIWKLVAK